MIMEKDWNYIKSCFNGTDKNNKSFLTKEEIEIFENRIKKINREKKLKRILNI